MDGFLNVREGKVWRNESNTRAVNGWIPMFKQENKCNEEVLETNMNNAFVVTVRKMYKT